eukprot:1971446-Rhodomonas_salina.1
MPAEGSIEDQVAVVFYRGAFFTLSLRMMKVGRGCVCSVGLCAVACGGAVCAGCVCAGCVCVGCVCAGR